MNQTTAAAAPAHPVTAGLPVDWVAVLASMQDQIDDLVATVQAQQRAIDDLRTAQSRTAQSRTVPAGPATGRG